MNINKLKVFNFRYMTIFWGISRWNRGQTNWNGSK